VSGFDVVVAGAGPSGSLAARQLALRGAKVLLADRVAFPRWKVCGACLGPGASAALEAAGLAGLPARLGGVPLAYLTLVSGERRARIALRGNRALSREALDAALVEAAVAAGAEFRPGCRVHLDDPSPGHGLELRLDGAEPVVVRANALIDATGLAGGLAGPRPDISPRSRIGLGAIFEEPPPDLLPGDLRMVVAPVGYAGLVRDERDRLTVAAAVDAEALQRRSPAEVVADILRTGASDPTRAIDLSSPSHGWKGTPLLTRRVAAPERPGIFRIGDAAGYVEPFTGEGMGWAMGAAVAVVPFVDAFLSGRADAGADWVRASERHAMAAQRFCRTVSWALRRPAFVNTSLRILRRRPSLAIPLVAAGSAPFHGSS